MQPLLNEKRAREALALRGKLTSKQIGRRLGVNWKTIRDLFGGRTWKHLAASDAAGARPKDAAAVLFSRLNAGPKDWLAILIATVRATAKRFDSFTTDDVWAILETRYPKSALEGGPGGCDPRLLGPAMKLAEQENICSRTDRYVPSERKVCRCRPVRVWRSEL